MKTTLNTAEKITEKLLDTFGPGELGLVEQIEHALFRATLSDGRYIMAGVGPSGNVWIKDLGVST